MSTTPTTPTITQLSEILAKKKEIMDYMDSHFREFKNDIIYYFKKPDDTKWKRTPDLEEASSKICVAGSFAVKKLATYLKLDYPDFVPNDKDVFVLNSEGHCRTILGDDCSTLTSGHKTGALDFVHIEEQSIERLLQHFDLPCCRCAINSVGDYYVSIHCLYALLTGTYYMPEYTVEYKNVGFWDMNPRPFLMHSEVPNFRIVQTMEIDKKAKEQVWKALRLPTSDLYNIDGPRFLIPHLLNAHKKGYGTNMKGKESKVTDGSLRTMLSILQGRMDKYAKRGFLPILYPTNEILPWMIHRFLYHEDNDVTAVSTSVPPVSTSVPPVSTSVPAVSTSVPAVFIVPSVPCAAPPVTNGVSLYLHDDLLNYCHIDADWNVQQIIENCDFQPQTWIPYLRAAALSNMSTFESFKKILSHERCFCSKEDMISIYKELKERTAFPTKEKLRFIRKWLLTTLLA